MTLSIIFNLESNIAKKYYDQYQYLGRLQTCLNRFSTTLNLVIKPF